MKLILAFALFLSGIMAFPQRSMAQNGPWVKASLISQYNAVVPYSETPIGLLLDITPGWHVYWQNPGDSGMAPQATWQNLSEHTSIEIMPWPVPHKIITPPLASYGYENQVLIPFNLHLAQAQLGDSFTLNAQIEWLVCKDMCLPESQQVILTLPVAEVAVENPRTAPLFAQTLQNTPQPAPYPLTAEMDKQFIDIILPPHVTEASFVPAVEGVIDDVAPQTLHQGRLRVRLNPAARQPRTHLQGLLLTNLGHWQIEPRLTSVLALPALNADFALGDLGLILLFALLGGLLLNLMPCVLPVLSLKILGLTKQHTAHDKKVYGNFYALGVVLSFLALGVTLLLLRAGGEALGWGFQLQSPVFVAGLIMLFTLFTLNLLGVFEILPPTPGFEKANHNNRSGAFLSGVLAAVVASPCTVPFMGSAVAYALARGGVTSVAVFVALGLGLAMPFLMIAYIPRLAALVPKPGPWLLWFKKILALPLAATAGWLVWVYLQQIHFTYFWTSIALLGLGVAMAGLLRFSNNLTLSRAKRYGYIMAVVVVLTGTLYGMQFVPSAQQITRHTQAWPPFSEARVQELNAEGKDVFVAFTAAWCITCKANEYLALHTDRTAAFFEAHHIVPLVADWTNRNTEIAEVLGKFGSQGVPFYLLYRHEGTVQVLPTLLTQESFERHLLQGR